MALSEDQQQSQGRSHPFVEDTPGGNGPGPIRRNESTRELLMRIQEPRTAWKRALLGGILFLIILVVSLFLAAQYVHKREGTLKKVATPKMAVRLPTVQEHKIVIRRYRLKPFLLRVRGRHNKRDRFLAIRVMIEFVQEGIPSEISSRREILRTLVYKQLVKHFPNGEKTASREKHFREELIPALNTFFKGGGVYDIRLDAFALR